MRGLGELTSQVRADLPGVANARACSWNRPPIDRMANLNLEPGDASLEDMIAAVEHGVYMQTNCSWSIDDSRNKFQFRLRVGPVDRERQAHNSGQEAELPSRVSAPSGAAERWLATVATVVVMGTPNWGKASRTR